MPNLKHIKNRIKSVKNTQKITQAMKMVAAAKVKKAENQVKASRPFSNELARSFTKLIASKPEIDKEKVTSTNPLDNYPELLKQRKLQTIGLMVVTSDKGLAGAYNANVVRRAVVRVREILREGLNVKLFILGTKGVQSLKKYNFKTLKTYTKLPAIPTPGGCAVIAEDLAESYINKEIDKIEIITTHFKSTLSYQVQLWQLLPVIIAPEKEAQGQEQKIEPEMLFEPNIETVLQKIVPLYFTNRIFQAMTEASASELAARMQAMSAATNNARDMIKILTIDYNKARQASITQELLEVVSGAQALEG
ncbi:MAG: ATP synthase F1 subunit gamma [Candidatus Melainabacteria bacterium GWA2_34_9]|nr:MAG: ATP synthase F1 subunit gamma [Candidatus Melainabacteria bacterium GWA2_34_9]